MTRLYLTPGAEADLREVARWVEQAAGNDIAVAYVERIRDRCDTLTAFPNRGSPRNAAGTIRSIPFERRATIVYRIEADAVVVLGIFHAGREIDIG